MDEPRNDVEAEIRTACEAQDFGPACTRALDAYGPEIMSFLIARLRGQSDGEEAFSMFAEDLWKGLPGFSFRCSVRGWMYTLARNAANRYASSPHRRVDRNLTINGRESVSALVDRARSATQAYLKTAVKDRVRALRERLPLEDQTLLILHVDRRLPWHEIAMVMHEQGAELDHASLDREAAKLRKRFERLKAELKELATKEGLIRG